MTTQFQEWQTQLTRMVEFSEATLATVGMQVVIAQEKGELPKLLVIGESLWLRPHQDVLLQKATGPIYQAGLSTSAGFGLLTLNPRHLLKGRDKLVLVVPQNKVQFQPLVKCELLQKAFVALQSLDLIERLKNHR
jgi:hypothetical protein